MNSGDNKKIIPAGASVVDVSPGSLSRGHIWMAGYLPRRYATEQAGPIEARALALGGPGDGLLIITIDSCIMSPLMARRWAEMISDAVPLPPDRIFITTTHTHSGPDICFLFGGIPPAYLQKIRSGALDAATCAWAAREPAEMNIGTATHSMGIPRRTKHGQTSMDNSVVVLQWRSGSRVISTLINLACHGVALPRTSTILSADIPGALALGTDSLFGGISLFIPRDQGDVNPDIPGKDAYEQDGSIEELERVSAMGINAVKQAVEASVPADSFPLCVTRKTIRIKSSRPALLLFNSPLWTGRLLHVPGVIDFDTRKFRIGEIRGTAVPGEVLHCLGKKILEKTGDPSLLFSYTGGYTGYLMTKKTFSSGGYEPNVSPGPIDPELM